MVRPGFRRAPGIFSLTFLKPEKVMETIQYRDYSIKSAPQYTRKRFMYLHDEYTGEVDNRIGYCNSIQECKREIDEYILEYSRYEVQTKSGKIESFNDFIVAVQAAIRSNGVLLTPIENI